MNALVTKLKQTPMADIHKDTEVIYNWKFRVNPVFYLRRAINSILNLKLAAFLIR